jgi:hypothetical protein
MATAAQLYERLQLERNWYLDRARTCAALTLPYLIPSSNEPGPHSRDTWQLPWTGIGADGVNNLASRLLLAMLPPTESFFRFALNELEVERAGFDRKQMDEMEKALSRMEQEVVKAIEATNDRVAVHEALLWLVVAGNSLLYVGDKGLRVIHLTRYVIDRDPIGNPLDLVVCEEISPEAASPEIRELAMNEADWKGLLEEPGKEAENLDRMGLKTIRVYTRVHWEGEKVHWHQEVKGKKVPGTEGRSPAHSCPWLPLRMSRVDGCSYGVSYVESRALADLQTADSLQQAVTEGSLAAAALRFLVKPNGVTKIKALAEAHNGDFVVGDPNDIGTIQSQKAQDIAIAQASLARIEARLSKIFMLSNVRDSERTTAEEVRLQALEIENGLGAIYSILTQEFQAPYVSRKLDLLTRSKKMESLPPDMVRPVVSVGLAAVGRNNDVEKLLRFITALGQSMPDAIPQFVKPTELIKRLAYSLGIQTQGLIRSEEEIAQEQAKAQEQAMTEQMLKSPMADPQKMAEAEALQMQMGGAMPPDAAAQPPTQPTQ